MLIFLPRTLCKRPDLPLFLLSRRWENAQSHKKNYVFIYIIKDNNFRTIYADGSFLRHGKYFPVPTYCYGQGDVRKNIDCQKGITSAMRVPTLVRPHQSNFSLHLTDPNLDPPHASTVCSSWPSRTIPISLILDLTIVHFPLGKFISMALPPNTRNEISTSLITHSPPLCCPCFRSGVHGHGTGCPHLLSNKCGDGHYAGYCSMAHRYHQWHDYSSSFSPYVHGCQIGDSACNLSSTAHPPINSNSLLVLSLRTGSYGSLTFASFGFSSVRLNHHFTGNPAGGHCNYWTRWNFYADNWWIWHSTCNSP